MSKKINILVVDDDKSIQNFLYDILSEEGYKVTTASNGNKALEYCKNETFQFVITDLYMPNMNGLQLLEEIQKLTYDIFVIIMTGFGSVPTAVNAIKRGAYDYFMKPLDASAICLTIQNACRQKDLEERNISLQIELDKTKEFEHQSKRLSKQVGDLFFLNSLTQSISTFTDLKKLQEFVLENCKKVLGLKSASVFLLDENNPDELILTSSSGEEARAFHGIRQKLGEGIAGKVALTKQPLLVTDIDKDLKDLKKTSPRYGSKSFICVPLMTQNKLIGIINVTNKTGEGAFTTDDVNILSILAGHAASAIANLRNYEKLSILNLNLQQQIDNATHELRQKNKDLSALKQYNENIIKSISLGLIVFDKNLQITYCNHPMQELLVLSKTPDHEVKINKLNLFDDDTWDDIYLKVILKQETKQLTHFEYTPTGESSRHFNIVVSPFNDEHQELIGGILVINDVTEQVKMEQKLAHSERLAVVGKLAAKVAHELNNPLDGILRFINLTIKQIKKDPTDPDILEYLTESRAGAIRMARIISSLLEFSRGMQPSFEKNQINETIRDAVKAMSPVAMSQNVKIITMLSDNVPKIPTGNLFQVFTNLIKNSIDAIDKEGVIYIRSTSQDESITVVIEDTGRGIPQNVIDQIFDPFFTTKPKGKGSGLGLAICVGIIEECGGQIHVNSTYPKGTTFTLMLPIAKIKQALQNESRP